MNKHEFILEINKYGEDKTSVSKVENKYGKVLPDIVKKLVSIPNAPVFFDDYRLLTNNEIINANSDLHVDFVANRFIPLIDCGENDFIIYNLTSSNWARYNIIDECCFMIRKNLEEIL